MSAWKSKRFWKEARVVKESSGFGVSLDGRPVKTPAKRGLIVPTEEFAQTIAAEWDAQPEVIQPLSMPFTRSANAAIDKVAIQHAEVADMLAAYGDSDLLCYRADSPEALVARQTALWDPILDWAATALNARLVPRVGVIHAPQDQDTLDRLNAMVHDLGSFQLTAFHDLVSLSGSLILGFACAQSLLDAAEIWEISRLDENWQAEQWGADEEAESTALIKKVAFIHAKQVFDLSGPN